MSTDSKLAEALRRCTTGVQMPGENFLRVSLESVQAGIEALAAHSQSPASGTLKQHRQGCDALGGYGHGIGPCSCGAEQEQAGEAVAYRISCPHEPDIGHWYDEEDLTEHGYTCVPLYTRPQQPLSDEQIDAAFAEHDKQYPFFSSRWSFEAGIEFALGITKEPKT